MMYRHISSLLTLFFFSSVASSCDYLVQIEPGISAKQIHFEYLRNSNNLIQGVKSEWAIGQSFQGYHINLCETTRAHRSSSLSQQVEIQRIKLEQAPALIAIEANDEVRQMGWLEDQDRENQDDENDGDEIRAMKDENRGSLFPSSDNWHITGQQGNTVACQNDATWSLHRMSSRNVTLPLPINRLDQSFSYVYQPTNRPVVYVMDTEVYVQNKQYGGRAQQVKTFVTIDESNLPFPLHGSHVAGIIGSARYGVQKWSQILSVVTLGRSGTGSWVNVLNAATWIATDAANRNPSIPAIVNLSLSGSKSDIVNSAINAMVDAGLIVVVAVGNSNIDACTQSPASAMKPVKVAASDNSDQFATFSNWGACVDVIAPGVSIQSTGPYDKMITMSGTSMAAPILAGIIASALANGDLSPSIARDNYQLKYFLNQKGVQNVISKIRPGTVNVLAQMANVAAPQCGSSVSYEREQEPRFVIQDQ